MVDVTGSILANDMGLGKTLPMLAAIVNSTQRALEFAFTNTRAPTRDWQSITPSKATLVIVPSACKSAAILIKT
jgi:SWI/SNF-related matrix-associated actin-dependent regulator of chromatin subfamily A3